MKLHWSPRSPFVRKVMIVAHELGLVDRIECVRTLVMTSKPNHELMLENPLSKLPTLILGDGTVLYDSPVICEYFDSLHAGPKLFPPSGKERFTAMRRQALADGFLDFLLLWRNEETRPAEQRSQQHLASFAERRNGVLTSLEKEAAELEASNFSIGHIAVGASLSYLDFRFAEYDWRKDHPLIAAWHKQFAVRPSVLATEPVDDS
jgi:glutathione S-transferase